MCKYCSKFAYCINGECKCRKGYEGDGYDCKDMNECVSKRYNKCHRNAYCLNTVGSYRCECHVGYAGNGILCINTTGTSDNDSSLCTGSWEIRMYYNSSSNSCQRFWYGGCMPLNNQNFFNDLTDSVVYEFSQCAYVGKLIADICHDEFDTNLLLSCGGDKETRWYYSQATRNCEEFYYDASCDYQTNSRNFFTKHSNCKQQCLKNSVLTNFNECLEQFDPTLKQMCGKGNWKLRYYYDKKEKGCRIFWWDKCQSNSRNQFDDLFLCQRRCEKMVASYLSSVFKGPCLEPFDEIYNKSCKASPTYEIRWYYNQQQKKCDHVYYGGCKSSSRNLFSTRSLCRQLCERPSNIIRGSPLASGELSSVKVLQLQYNKYYLLNSHFTECLEPFEEWLTCSCRQGKWVRRYFYSKSEGTCKLYCSSSNNNFNDLASCKWKCEGKHINPRSRSCLDTFDSTYLKKCWTEDFYEQRYYFNHEKKQCELFYYGGCSSNSKNIFLTYKECKDLCERPSNELFRACYEPFDHDYEKSCSTDGTYRMQYYYDNEIKQCRMFWYGNCKKTSENIFPTLATCQWICERRKIEEIPRKCIDKFDKHYADSCNAEVWKEKWYFDHTTGLCSPFWYGGCKSDAQNIFDDLDTCLWLCEKPGNSTTIAYMIDDDYKCLEDLDIGYCDEKYPAFFYNKYKGQCEPFAYSGCGGNGNRFLTLKQCETTCSQFKHLSEPETGCHLPLAIGHGNGESGCQQHSGFRYYFNKQYGRCGRFWYNGCGGNGNQFVSYELCERICNNVLTKIWPRKLIKSCFMPMDVGDCGKAVKTGLIRWFYNPVEMECQTFIYSGCGGTDNRFATKYTCDKLCSGLIKPVSGTSSFKLFNITNLIPNTIQNEHKVTYNLLTTSTKHSSYKRNHQATSDPQPLKIGHRSI
uniref:Kunitz/Bovine pancreatic trypsin inhibitor domain protein n=1 Tax=Syphacia muris TaxID=451379 RepID=A0A0N5AWV6_9BILA